MTDDRDERDEETESQEYEVTVSARGVRFELYADEGAIFVLPDEIERIAGDVRQAQEAIRPINEIDLQNMFQWLQQVNVSAAPGRTPRIVLVSVKRRADDKGYILRFYERDADREWNCSTMGEYRAMYDKVRWG